MHINEVTFWLVACSIVAVKFLIETVALVNHDKRHHTKSRQLAGLHVYTIFVGKK